MFRVQGLSILMSALARVGLRLAEAPRAAVSLSSAARVLAPLCAASPRDSHARTLRTSARRTAAMQQPPPVVAPPPAAGEEGVPASVRPGLYQPGEQPEAQAWVVDVKNNKRGIVQLHPKLFAQTIRTDLLHRVIEWQRAARRPGM